MRVFSRRKGSGRSQPQQQQQQQEGGEEGEDQVMVELSADAPTGSNAAAGMMASEDSLKSSVGTMTTATVPMIKSSKSFASKSLGERDKTGAQVTLYRVRYKVKDTSSFNWRKPFSPLKDRYLIGHPEPVTGTLDPGMMFALMGSSGSGKSTLMDVIARRKTMGTIGGLILFDGHIPSKAEVIRDTGYVEQYDTLWEFFTVHEMLMYTARLKMSPKFTLQQKRDRVDEVIEHLGLGKARNTKIGGPMVRGVSGGEAKRISIGIGLLNNPRIMFFDEPTSGLDSAISNDVMQVIRNLADSGRTVMVTIHQPSGMVFRMFDQIILLSSDPETRSGNLVYFGEAGDHVKDYFVEQGYPYDRERFDNIPEYLLSVVSGGVKGPTAGGTLIKSYVTSEMCDTNESIAKGITSPLGGVHAGEQKIDRRPVYANNVLSEIVSLVTFKGRAQWKNPSFVISRIGLYIALSVILVSFFAPQHQTPQALLVVVSLLFITILMTAFITFLYIPELIHDKPVFVRETYDAMYRVLSYAASTFIIETSAIAVSSICYTSLLYYSIGGLINKSVGAFFFFMLTHFVYSATACLVTLTFASPMPNIQTAIGLSANPILINVVLMGFLIPLPDWWGFWAFVSYMRWAWAALMINQFEGQNLDMCADVPQSDMISLTSGVDTMDVGSLSLDGALCSLYTGLKTYNSYTSAIPDATARNLTSLPPFSCSSNMLDAFFNPGIATLVNSSCSPVVADLMFEPLPKFPEQVKASLNNIGVAMLQFFPQGQTYSSEPKLFGLSKWECFGYLCIVFAAFFVAFWLSTKLSILLVRR